MDGVVRVLIVDDSAYIRKVVRQMLSKSPFIEVVGTAHDGEEALELVEKLRPDVVTVDLNMPRLDGLEFIRQQMACRPIPIVLLSVASESGDLVIQALGAGADDVVRKPTALATEKVLDISDELVAKVKAASGARVRESSPTPVLTVRTDYPQQARRSDIVVIGVSTGGPQALKQLIPQLPREFPVPVAMVLHMPVGYTEPYARSLAEVSHLDVAEARDGDPLSPGLVLLAPAGYHLTVTRRADGAVIARLNLRPLDTVHRPSVDVLFRSAAEVYGGRVLAAVLTGMGSDGTLGAGWIKAQGGRVFTEAEETCVVYGMPRSVVEAGLSDASFPLPEIARALSEAL